MHEIAHYQTPVEVLHLLHKSMISTQYIHGGGSYLWSGKDIMLTLYFLVLQLENCLHGLAVNTLFFSASPEDKRASLIPL